MTYKFLISLIAILGVLTLISCSQDDGMVFADNSDGAGRNTGIIGADKAARLMEKFGEQGIDSNGDGALTHEEIKGFFSRKFGGENGWKKSHRGSGHFGMMRDWDVSKIPDEVRNKMIERHPDADSDGDGYLSDPELESFKTSMMEKFKDGGFDKMRGDFRARIMEKHPEADADGDGTLSKEEMHSFFSEHKGEFGWKKDFNWDSKEHRAKIIEHHPEADTDGDGHLSDEEFEAFKSRMKEHFKGKGWAHCEKDEHHAERET